jgi:hypothetical protein
MEIGEFEGNAANPRYAEFRRYLDDKQLMNELTKVLVQLYETSDKPTDSFGYCRDNFSKVGGVDITVVNEENGRLRIRLEELKSKLEVLEKELADLN